MNVLRDQKGQITIFLSLMFLVLAFSLLCILDGIRSYLNEGLSQDALNSAGKEVTSNYSPELYKRYHLFFLDPREESFIIPDGMQSMNMYCEQNQGISCEQLTVTEKKKILDDNCTLLKSQIKEYVVYEKLAEEKEKWSDLLKFQKSTEEQARQKREEIEQLDSGLTLSEEESTENVEGIQQPEEESPDVNPVQQKEDHIRWKETKNLLKSIFHSGILLYVTDDRAVSELKVDTGDMPSTACGAERDAVSLDLSFNNIRELKRLLNTQTEEADINGLLDGAALLTYVDKYFRTWQEDSWEMDTALHYEMEYIIAGKDKDHDNLKSIAERIFISRFIANYSYIVTDASLGLRAEEIALAVTGILGVPEVKDAVKQILLAALSSGEALLDVHTLFAGRKVPFMKSKETWTISFENAIEVLQQKKLVAEGRKSMSYKDYLNLFLLIRMQQDKNYLRMADVMQWNIRLDQPEFFIRDCIGSYSWEAQMTCTYQYPNPVGTGKQFVIQQDVTY